ncbi:hypothetical protein HUT18_10180 [Streptomyces sp. NA04227]|uniref:hypothetical protein n=1 Tax=Streptomyces sp. NA04227 TaxID=2742136 RepID=UPI001590D4D0|nr:hypothetical protein [Streptomyces sp. NA04227]QKW04961.1 hypothetical protein HUT18_10180 [Streptomyces sp. NA04227]
MHIGQLPLRAAAATALLLAAPATAAEASPGDTAGEGQVTVRAESPADRPASGEGAASLHPAAVGRGAKVEITVTGCPGTTARAYSPAFAAPADLGPAAKDGHSALLADARVRQTAKSGEHRVRIACGNADGTADGTADRTADRATDRAPGRPSDGERALSSTFRVIDVAGSEAEAGAGAGAREGGGHGDDADHRAPGTHADPATQLAAQPELAGPGAPHAVTGLALASVAAVAVALRSVRRRREEGTGGGNGG